MSPRKKERPALNQPIHSKQAGGYQEPLILMERTPPNPTVIFRSRLDLSNFPLYPRIPTFAVSDVPLLDIHKLRGATLASDLRTNWNNSPDLITDCVTDEDNNDKHQSATAEICREGTREHDNQSSSDPQFCGYTRSCSAWLRIVWTKERHNLFPLWTDANFIYVSRSEMNIFPRQLHGAMLSDRNSTTKPGSILKSGQARPSVFVDISANGILDAQNY
ncbi:hypothetical protein J6590_051594 [Homalodisca vitripennis]|nr:hypothetical protein J6590_051594 [Homalodisca vitripennis]